MTLQNNTSQTATWFEKTQQRFVLLGSAASPWDQASWALLGVLAVLVALTFQHYGVTWDEPVDTEYGKAIGLYYVSLLHGHYNASAIRFENVSQWGHSGGFDTTLAALNFISPFGKYETRHLLCAVIGLIGIIGGWKLAHLLGGPKLAFLVALLLSITARYYGGMFNDGKDIPFAAFYIWSIYYLVKMLPVLPRVPWSLAAKFAAAVGATLSIRVGGLLLLCYLGLVLGVWWVALALRKGPSLWSALGRLASLFISVTLLAWVIMLIFWPWAQLAPFHRPLQALSGFSHYDWKGPVLFAGREVMSDNLPRIYLFQWLAITLPEVYFLGFVLAILSIFYTWLRNPGALLSSSAIKWSIVAFSAVFPLIYEMIQRPVLYDGARHFLFTVPPLACLAAGGLLWAVAGLSLTWSRTAAACMLAYVIFEIVTMVRLHPNEYVYFNEFVGGLPGAYGRYETDYWGNSYREAVLSLAHFVQMKEPAARSAKYKVYLTSVDRSCVTYFFPKNFSVTYSPLDADFFIATTRFNADRFVDGPVVLEVKRFGVPLAVVKDLSLARERRDP
jgi:hypothetical protein